MMQVKHEICLEIFYKIYKMYYSWIFLKKFKNSKHIFQGYFQKKLESYLDVYDHAKIL